MSPAPPTSTQMLARLLGGSKTSTRLGVVALACILLTLVILGLSIWPLIRLRTQPKPTIAEARSDAKFLAEFDNATDADLAQIEGRSLFALPRPPSPRQETAQKPDPSKPTRYGGPSVIAMVNGRVWFSDGQRLAAGESGAGSLKVVSLNAPWSAKVEWMGGEFDVEFFQRSPLLMPASASASPADHEADRPERTPRRRNSAAGRTSRSSQPPAPPSSSPSPPTPQPPPPAEPVPDEPEPPMHDPGPEPAPEPPADPAPAPAQPPTQSPDPASDPASPPPPAPTDPEASRP